MSNLFFTPAPITRLSLARSDEINTIQLALEAGFDKVPPQAKLEGGLMGFGVATGAVNTYALAVTPLVAVAYVTGMEFTFLANLNNTGAATLNVNGIGARSIVRIDGTALALNDLRAGQPYRVVYNGTSFVLISQSGAIASSGVVVYEEGNWTPVISDGTNNATMSGATFGKYTKIGRQVTVSGYCITTALGSVTGAIRMTGLPYTPSSPFLGGGAFAQCLAMALPAAGTTVTGFLQNGNAFITLLTFDLITGSSGMQATEWSNTGSGQFTFTYFAT